MSDLLHRAATSLRDIHKKRVFLWLSIKAELKASCYAGSWLGSSWWLLEPLLLMFVYLFVVEILRGRNSVSYGALFIFASILPYRWFSRSIARCTAVLVGSAGLMKQVPFPKLLIPLSTVLANTMHFLFGCIILFLLVFLYKVDLAPVVFWFPAIVFIQMVFTLGVGLFFAAGTVFVRDLKGVVPFLLRLLLFISPIFYNVEEVPLRWRNLYLFGNPLASLLGSYKNILLYQRPPYIAPLLSVLALGAILIVGGIFLYARIDKRFVRWV